MWSRNVKNEWWRSWLVQLDWYLSARILPLPISKLRIFSILQICKWGFNFCVCCMFYLLEITCYLFIYLSLKFYFWKVACFEIRQRKKKNFCNNGYPPQLEPTSRLQFGAVLLSGVSANKFLFSSVVFMIQRKKLTKGERSFHAFLKNIFSIAIWSKTVTIKK